MRNTALKEEIVSLLRQIEPQSDFDLMMKDRNFQSLLEIFRHVDAFSLTLKEDLSEQFSNRALNALRQLRSVYALTAGRLFSLVQQLAEEITPEQHTLWQQVTQKVLAHKERKIKVARLLAQYSDPEYVSNLLLRLETEDAHGIYPTSPYRTSAGTVNSNADSSHIEAVMTTSTMTEIQITEGVLEKEHPVLRNMYQPFGRCVCVIDANVHQHYGDQVISYFKNSQIELKMLVYRAMEVDKSIHMVERLLADFKRLGVSRQEPVLIIGGGVITDIGGLACALYHRNTPYVMLATSIVSGIDAGPSPRTCCDGFGFKNLFGAYHAPILTLTDRTFFKTLRTGWIRHGVAEIIKMAVVKDAKLFRLLEETGIELVTSKFGADTSDLALRDTGNQVLYRAMRSYVEAEYSNLYETHQCRPHAYGHTWSPGYEIPSGMLHGHAISCGMGFGAQLSYLQGWISREDRDRILQVISDFELSLWHPILENADLLYQAQIKITEKRGGNLAAPLPKGRIGECGYLNELSLEELETTLVSYKILCETYPRMGLGVETHCREVGLEDPSTVGHTSDLERQLIEA
ncbi:MAG: sedoheptulose 7-phosphate cyclase [Bacteroidota bacterium]